MRAGELLQLLVNADPDAPVMVSYETESEFITCPVVSWYVAEDYPEICLTLGEGTAA